MKKHLKNFNVCGGKSLVCFLLKAVFEGLLNDQLQSGALQKCGKCWI